MQTLAFLLVAGVLVGGTSLGRFIRDRPVVLLPLTTFAAAAFYSLRVVQ